MKILSIIAAGRSSRFKSHTTKPFAKIKNNKTTLQYILSNSINFFDIVVLVVSDQRLVENLKFEYSHVIICEQAEPRGNTEAVFIAMKAISHLHHKISFFAVQWADQPFYFQSDYLQLFSECKGVLIPAYIRDKPYVNWVFNKKILVRIEESKEMNIGSIVGIQDGGIFCFNSIYFLKLRQILENNSKNSSTSFSNFVHVLKDLNLKISNFKLNCMWYNFLNYNTIEEFRVIKLIAKKLNS